MKPRDNPKPKNSRTFVFPYLTGFITASVIFLILFGLLGYRVGYPYILDRLHSLLPGRPSGHEAVMRLPQSVVEELTELKAVVRNAGNPTKQPRHDTILVHPEDEIGYVLNSNVTIYGHMLKSTRAFNFDPPVLYLDKPYEELSDRLKAYVSAESRLQNTYSVDEDGFRVTLPSVTTERTILIIGDSVAFGVGVNDDSTAASVLQRMLGEQYRVINAGVGGYRGQQCFLMADRLSKDRRFAGLIYIACQNDFMRADDWGEEAEDIVEKLGSIADRFSNNIILLLHTYMEYNLNDIFVDKGWEDEDIEKTTRLRDRLKTVAGKSGISYGDWTDIVDRYRKDEKTILAPFALYADRCHLSPLGNDLMARKLFAMVTERWVSDASN